MLEEYQEARSWIVQSGVGGVLFEVVTKLSGDGDLETTDFS